MSKPDRKKFSSAGDYLKAVKDKTKVFVSSAPRTKVKITTKNG